MERRTYCDIASDKIPRLLFLLLCTLFIPLFLSSTVYAKSYKPLKISKQPRSKITARYDGEPIELLVEMNGGSGDYRYQWQKQKHGSEKWTNLKNGKDEYLEMKANYSHHRTKYRCKITDIKTKKSVITRTTTLKISTKPLIVSQPKTVRTRQTGVAEFEVKTKGKHLLYQWYVSKDSGKTWKKANSKTSKLVVPDVTRGKNGNMYRCKVTHAITKKTRYSKRAKLIVTDLNTKYWYNLKSISTKGLLKPKAADGYVYVGSYNTEFQQAIKSACEYINTATGINTFVYTPSISISDIIITDWSNTCTFQPTIHTDNDIVSTFNSNEAKQWAGVTFVEDVNHEHYFVGLNRTYMKSYTNQSQTAVVVHELGHCIGIQHSSDENSIMYAYTKSSKMTSGDILLFMQHIQKVKNIANGEVSNMPIAEKKYACYGSR